MSINNDSRKKVKFIPQQVSHIAFDLLELISYVINGVYLACVLSELIPSYSDRFVGYFAAS